jgi:hypothetical protein
MVDIHLTEEERMLILSEVILDLETEEPLKAAIAQEGRLVVSYSLEDLDLLLGSIAATANHADTPQLEKRLGKIYDRLQGRERTALRAEQRRESKG